MYWHKLALATDLSVYTMEEWLVSSIKIIILYMLYFLIIQILVDYWIHQKLECSSSWCFLWKLHCCLWMYTFLLFSFFLYLFSVLFLWLRLLQLQICQFLFKTFPLGLHGTNYNLIKIIKIIILIYHRLSTSNTLEPSKWAEYASLCASLVQILNIDQGIKLH